jgi:protein SCO1/2
MRRSSLVLWAAALIIAGVFGVAAWRTGLFGAPVVETSDLSTTVAVGGPFHLTDQGGRPVNEAVLKGKWSAVFFGYTSCPDVCPTTLYNLAQAIRVMGAKAKNFQVLFISIDPERDTPAQLVAFLDNPAFPRGTIGLTGSPDDVAAAARAYHVYYKKAGTGSAYTMDHTSIVYLMDPKGAFIKPVTFDAPPPVTAAQIEQSISGN